MRRKNQGKVKNITSQSRGPIHWFLLLKLPFQKYLDATDQARVPPTKGCSVLQFTVQCAAAVCSRGQKSPERAQVGEGEGEPSSGLYS